MVGDQKWTDDGTLVIDLLQGEVAPYLYVI